MGGRITKRSARVRRGRLEKEGRPNARLHTVSLEDTVLSDIDQSRKDKHRVIPLTRGP